MTQFNAIELTEEDKDRLAKICDEMIDELHKRVKGPVEAYMVMHFMKESLEELFGFEGGIALTKGEVGKA